MNYVIKIGLATFTMFALSFSTKAETTTKSSASFTIRKDSLTVQATIDTNKKVILFPNPFNFFLIGEEKK